MMRREDSKSSVNRVKSRGS